MGIKTSNACNIGITAFFHWQVPRIKLFIFCMKETPVKGEQPRRKIGHVFFVFCFLSPLHKTHFNVYQHHCHKYDSFTTGFLFGWLVGWLFLFLST